ncbi:unnamed protein product [Urochloa humidicola]
MVAAHGLLPACNAPDFLHMDHSFVVVSFIVGGPISRFSFAAVMRRFLQLFVQEVSQFTPRFGSTWLQVRTVVALAPCVYLVNLLHAQEVFLFVASPL